MGRTRALGLSLDDVAEAVAMQRGHGLLGGQAAWEVGLEQVCGRGRDVAEPLMDEHGRSCRALNERETVGGRTGVDLVRLHDGQGGSKQHAATTGQALEALQSERTENVERRRRAGADR